MSALNAISVSKMVDKRLEREEVEEVIHNNTVLTEGHFVTTVIWRQPERTVPVGLPEDKKTYVETRWMICVDGVPQSSGIASTVWS